jgi:hypothetical protein
MEEKGSVPETKVRSGVHVLYEPQGSTGLEEEEEESVAGGGIGPGADVRSGVQVLHELLKKVTPLSSEEPRDILNFLSKLVNFMIWGSLKTE